MEANQNPQAESVMQREVRLDLVYRSLRARKRHYILPMLIVLVLSAVYIYSQPRYYEVEIILAPETSSNDKMSKFSGMASMVDIDLSSMMNSEDAIIPLFYPDLIESKDFIVPFFDMQVTTADGKWHGALADYLTTQAPGPWWSSGEGKPIAAKKNGRYDIDPFRLTKEQDAMARSIAKSISCDVDKKTQVITIKTQSLDPLVATTLADSVKNALQRHMTDYRTKKARQELAHLVKVRDLAEKDYLKKQKAYSTFADTHQELDLASMKTRQSQMEEDMQGAYAIYTKLQSQCVAAESKVLERTPVFTTVQAASVPVKPAGPKRLFFIITMLMVCFAITSVVLLVKDKSLKW
ncbi:MAG: hypothetical protein MR679_08665 [Bacteroidales bacterium]|nr:hypothetical protein [Bacteroidales bacterium]